MSNLTRPQHSTFSCSHFIRGFRCRECFKAPGDNLIEYFCGTLALLAIMALIYFALIASTPICCQ